MDIGSMPMDKIPESKEELIFMQMEKPSNCLSNELAMLL
jgi:hypothetical protein